MNARKKAYQILCDVVIEKQYSNLALKKGIKAFDAKDKAFISNIVYGTIQNYGYLKYNWKRMVKKGVPKEIEILINMSAYQLLMNDRIPAYAVINEAVAIATDKYEGRFSGLVNAVLRRLNREGMIRPRGESDESLAIMTSLPLWIVKMWNAQYGEDVTKKLCKDSCGIAPMYIRVNTLKSSDEELLETGSFKQTDREHTLIFSGNDIGGSDWFKFGKITVQDYAAQMPVDILNPQPGERILDMCSAPGSKTAQMSAQMHNKGEIIALELHEHRCELTRQNLRRLGCINAEVKQVDATGDLKELGMFDKILLDAPCSGYGVLKRKSDIKLHMHNDDMDAIIKSQKQLLMNADKCLKVNGTLVYSTCTLNKKENDNQIRDFIKTHDNYEVINQMTIFPYVHNCDGFFVCELRKKDN